MTPEVYHDACRKIDRENLVATSTNIQSYNP